MTDALTRMLEMVEKNPLKTVDEFADFGRCDDPECEDCRAIVAHRCMHVCIEDALVRMVEAVQVWSAKPGMCCCESRFPQCEHCAGQEFRRKLNAIAAEVVAEKGDGGGHGDN